MTNFICEQCGVQFAATEKPPECCPICEDERQYVNWAGQRWTTLTELQRSHRNVVGREGPGVYGISTQPQFAIGQRALLVTTPEGNILWDCITLIDEATVEVVERLGGVDAIAVSHPHYYSAVVEWSAAFGDAPIYLHAKDQEWIMRPDERIVLWEGETNEIAQGLTLIRCGVHFRGGTVMHYSYDGSPDALYTGDIFDVVADRSHVSFMYSYPNSIPERPEVVRSAAIRVEPFDFERVYGAWWGYVIPLEGKRALARSVERYLRYTEHLVG